MTRFTVVGVDPGKHTGVAVATFETVGYTSASSPTLGLPSNWIPNVGMVLTIEQDAFLPQFKNVLDIVKATGDEVHVAVEKFVVTRTAMIGQATQALVVTGLVQASLFYASIPHSFSLQTPGDAKTIFTNKKLKDGGILAPRHGYTDHAIDAIRHAMLCGLRTIRPTT